MRQWLKERIGIILVACFLLGGIGSTAWYFLSPSSGPIYTFDYDRDAQEILQRFDADWYWLVAQSRDEYSPEYMLKYKAPHQNPLYAGRMKIYVARQEDQFVGFITYYMKNKEDGFLNFVDVKPEFRGKGYAQQLVQFALKDFKKMGAKRVSLITRPSNENARKLYTRLGFQETFNDGQFVGYVYYVQ